MHYDPTSKYVCTRGPISLKEPGGTRRLVDENTTDEKGQKYTFSMKYATPAEIAYLVEFKQTHMLYTEWLKTPEGKAFKKEMDQAKKAQAEAEKTRAEEAKILAAQLAASKQQANLKQKEATHENS